VSITDHDSIAASRTLLTLSTPAEAPVSLEWTAPFGAGYFHVGVHNLPVTFAGEIVEALLDTRCAYCQTFGASSAGRHDERCLPHVQDWMNRLSSIPDTLLVLNHPLRDLSGLGHTAHRRLLTSFLLRHRKHLHAIELNAMRSWAENQDVLEVSSEFGLPVVSGGDRHGSEPSAALNLTMATGFSEFAREIRSGKPPVVLFTRQYRRPLTLRKLQVAWEFLKASAPPAGGAARWSDRVFVPWRDGRALPLSAREWSGSFANELIAGRESPKGLPGDAMNRAEH
jgi:hypothetical protein